MSRARLALLALGAGILGSQAGHLLTYELRFGAAAQQLQSSGVHTYFPTVAKTGLGLASFALIVAMLALGFARVAAGKQIGDGPAPAFLRLLAIVYTLQLALFAGQETVEAALGTGTAGSGPLLVLWGAFGQLPVAVAATLSVRWLLVKVRPALTLLRLRAAPVYQLLVEAFAVRSWPAAAELAQSTEIFDSSYVRGPPSF